MAIYVLTRRKPNCLNDPANLLKRFADVHRNVTKDLEDRSEFSNLALSLTTAQAIVSLPPAIKFQSIHNEYGSFVHQKIVAFEIPEMNRILTEYTRLLSEYEQFEKKASSRQDLLEAHKQKIAMDKERPILTKLFDACSSISPLFTFGLSAISGLIIYGNPHNWLNYITLVTIPIGFLIDRSRYLYHYMAKPADKQIVGVGSLREFELAYVDLNRKLRQLKKDASEVQRNLTLMCRSDLDSILITILKDNPPLNAETSNLLDKLAAKTSSSVLNQEISRILGPQNPDILSALRVRPLA